MEVVNKTRKIVISESAGLAKTFEERRRGLSCLDESKDLILVSEGDSVMRSMIHMWGMRFPIDVLWVNSDGLVVDVRRNLKPFSVLNPLTWRFYIPRKPARYMVELGSGKLGTTEIGDNIEFK